MLFTAQLCGKKQQGLRWSSEAIRSCSGWGNAGQEQGQHSDVLRFKTLSPDGLGGLPGMMSSTHLGCLICRGFLPRVCKGQMFQHEAVGLEGRGRSSYEHSTPPQSRHLTPHRCHIMDTSDASANSEQRKLPGTPVICAQPRGCTPLLHVGLLIISVA